MKVELIRITENPVEAIELAASNKKCTTCGEAQGIMKNYKGELYCDKHYRQLLKFGYIKQRTTYDKNEIIIVGNIVTMLLYNKKGDVINETIFDEEELDTVKKYKWGMSGNGYVTSRINGQIIYLHRFLTGVTEEFFIDHIDRNRLNNLKANLRTCTNQENLRNTSLSKNNTSGQVGVHWESRRKHWVAIIETDYKKSLYLGSFDNLEDAIIARIEAEKQYFGEFAPKTSNNSNELEELNYESNVN
ncbi:HNH endonuclease [Clostridium sp.]|uniref:HNH endonuclease n=1 Tax=Clostridium sp. TaxID=1506 RepID=UPI001A3FD01D|nr:HNH endonuclease [Clostridium sp.]MBK5239868.1 HNH endonuclease [Clostridium sp.]